MTGQDPRIIELDPESAPRTSALILIVIGALGACFLLVNVVFTGDDPYYDYGSWNEDPEPSGNAAFYMIPSFVRDAEAKKDEEKATEEFEAKGKPVKKPGDKRSAADKAAKPGDKPKAPAKAGDSVIPGAAPTDSGGVVIPGAAK